MDSVINDEMPATCSLYDRTEFDAVFLALLQRSRER